MFLRIIFTTLISCLLLGCNGNVENANKPDNSLREEIRILSNSSIYKSKLADEAKVEQNTKIIEIFDNKFETVLKQPIPSFTFIFPCQEVNEKPCNEKPKKLDLPQEAIPIIDDYWNQDIRFRYLEDVKGTEFTQEQMEKLSLRHLDAIDDFEDKIQKIIIDAPSGKRNISGFEAEQIRKLIISFSDEIIQKTKEVKKSKNHQSA